MKKILHFSILTLIALCFNGCGWFVPYSFQPSYHKFKEICQLEPEIYQANGGKLDEEYYNKVLKYFDTSLDTMSDVKTLRISDDKKHFSYWFEKWIGAGNEGTGFYLSGDRENCDYFKKGLNNAK